MVQVVGAEVVRRHVDERARSNENADALDVARHGGEVKRKRRPRTPRPGLGPWLGTVADDIVPLEGAPVLFGCRREEGPDGVVATRSELIRVGDAVVFQQVEIPEVLLCTERGTGSVRLDERFAGVELCVWAHTRRKEPSEHGGVAGLSRPCE
ncbi:hypothetical protein VTI74DRAFT_245 [Chaetomium olivicolor]